MSVPLKVLVLGYVWPEPNSSAAGRHMLSLLQCFLTQQWQVSFASPALRGEHKIDLTALGITEHEIALNCESFDQFIGTLQPDIVLFDRFMLEEQFGWRVAAHCPGALRILDTEDLHSLRHARHQALKQQREMQISDLNSDMAKREIAAIFRCDLSLIISQYEYDLLQNHYQVPAQLLMHCPFILELNDAKQTSAVYAQRQHFISIGNFRHEPNWDAVLWLKTTIWPLIHQQIPQAELHIYGAYPPPKATQLHNPKQGFLIKGWAKDAQQVMTQARVCLAPLRFGAGLKGKLVEAMLCGTPSITTSVGFEGMGSSQTEEWPGSVIPFNVVKQTESAIIIAQQAIAHYQRPELWQQAQHKTSCWLQQYFNGETTCTLLVTKIKQIASDLTHHRAANFIGQMLQYHQFKSTQYMAQWIEAKNRQLK